MSILRPISYDGEYRDLYIVPGTPTLYLGKFDLLILADLHLGFEEAVARGLDYSSNKTNYAVGMFIPKIQLKKIIESLERVFKVLSPRRVLINGDLKHAFDRLLRQERLEVREFLNYLYNKGVQEVVVVRGNHDNYLPLVLKDYGIELVNHYEIDTGEYKLLFTHGHLEVDINKYDIIVIGHEHPSMRCFGTYRFPAFLKIPTSRAEIIVLPAIGPYHPGTQVSLDRDNYLSPIIKKYGDLDRAKIIVSIDLGEYKEVPTEFSLERELVESGILRIDRFNILNHEIAIIEFSSIEIALLMCGSF
ncbi:MAG: metallophosphoesterase [Desulfurococcales archaeon ex4484_58]|nr:MAG: metallophosphoesterase [Desulfurococcales archaeon ex4484_58]